MLLFLSVLAHSAIIGFDLGTEGIRAAVLRSGKTIELVLNEQSKRKTPSMVSFETNVSITPDNVRLIDRRVGFAAQSVLSRNRSAVIRGIPEILGKSSSAELEKHLKDRMYDFNFDGSLVNGIEPHVPLAMLFEKLVNDAERQFQQGSLRDAVISVPSFFTYVQRSKIASAAKIAGLNLKKIIDDKMALAYVYAIEKTGSFTREPKTVAMVDFGSSYFTISGFRFSAKIVTQKGRNPKPVPKIEELGYVWDDSIGGLDIDVLIANRLMEKYRIEQMSTLLLSDAQRIKHALTLTGNANITLETTNTRILFSQEEFNELCQPIFDKILYITQSLNQKFDAVEFVGASTRIPKVQDIVSSILGPQTRSLNADEAIVVGAAYIASSTSGTMQLMDINYEPLSIHNISLVTGDKAIRIMNEGSSMSKLKTTRYDSSNDMEFSIEYSSRVPIGSSKIIGKWRLDHENEIPVGSRIALSFGINEIGLLELSKSLLYLKGDNGEINQIPLGVKQIYKPLKSSEEMRQFNKQLVNAFSLNDVRLAKIAEARNALEALIFEIRGLVNKDPVIQKVSSKDEITKIQDELKKYIQWIETHHEFDDESELKSKSNALNETFAPLRYRSSESKNREASIHELEYLLNDMQDAVLNRWPQKKLKVPKKQRKAILNHVSMTKEWLTRMLEEQGELSPWDEPVLKTSEIRIRIKKLGDAFKNLEEGVINKKLKNHRDGEDEDEFGADL